MIICFIDYSAHTEILLILSVDIPKSVDTLADHPTQAVMDCDTPTVIRI